MKRAMQRVVTAAVVVVAVWLFAAGHVEATTSKSAHHQTTCHQIRSALSAGKSKKEVEKELKVSSQKIRQCQQQKTTSAASPERSSQQAR